MEIIKRTKEFQTQHLSVLTIKKYKSGFEEVINSEDFEVNDIISLQFKMGEVIAYNKEQEEQQKGCNDNYILLKKIINK